MADEFFTPAVMKNIRKLIFVPGVRIPVSKVMETLSNPDQSYDDLVKKYPALKKVNQDEIFLSITKILKIVEEFLEKERDKYLQKEMEKMGLESPQTPKTLSRAKTPEASSIAKTTHKKYTFEIERDINEVDQIKIFIDGCSRGNPGPSSIAVIFTDLMGKKLFCYNELIGEATNNIAEYKSLIVALEKACEFKKDKIFVFSDSELLVNQMNGVYKVKNINILKIISRAQELRRKFKNAQIIYIPREQNRETDVLASRAFKNVGENSANQENPKESD